MTGRRGFLGAIFAIGAALGLRERPSEDEPDSDLPMPYDEPAHVSRQEGFAYWRNGLPGQFALGDDGVMYYAAEGGALPPGFTWRGWLAMQVAPWADIYNIAWWEPPPVRLARKVEVWKYRKVGSIPTCIDHGFTLAQARRILLDRRNRHGEFCHADRDGTFYTDTPVRSL